VRHGDYFPHKRIEQCRRFWSFDASGFAVHSPMISPFLSLVCCY
jgi:hypothetical protein